MKRYDAIIIGFGKGGKILAADLAKRGQSVAVVEQQIHKIINFYKDFLIPNSGNILLKIIHIKSISFS